MSGAHVTVQPLSREDIAELVAVDAMARASFHDPTFSAAAELDRPWALLWVAYLDGAPAGFLEGWHVIDELHVLHLATHPDLRRRGVARALLARALAYAAEHQVRILLLEVRRSNHPAIQLYRAFSFAVLHVRPRYYADNDEDAIEMILELDPVTGQVRPGRDEVDLEG